MKIIDKTPLQDANGNISFPARVQGTLKYGLNWFAELEAQKAVIAQLDRSLEKGFVLIRNFTLPNIEVVIPLILIGPGGISVIYATPVKGFFEAKGDQWNTVTNGRPQPASINLLDIVTKRARALQRYLQEQKINLPNPVEPVLIATDPGAHIDSMRPTVRVVMSDAIKQFASSLLQAAPIWRSDLIYDLADRITDPRPPEEPKMPRPNLLPRLTGNPLRAPKPYSMLLNRRSLLITMNLVLRLKKAMPHQSLNVLHKVYGNLTHPASYHVQNLRRAKGRSLA